MIRIPIEHVKINEKTLKFKSSWALVLIYSKHVMVIFVLHLYMYMYRPSGTFMKVSEAAHPAYS
jgi:hypothetical protein